MKLLFTIRIYVADRDPAGLSVIDMMNWTGVGILFARHKWLEATSYRESEERKQTIILKR